MASYETQTGVYLKFDRPAEINISNPYLGRSVVSYKVEQVIDLDGEVIKTQKPDLSKMFIGSEEFDILDIGTGLPTGQKMTEGAMQVAIYSHFLALKKRIDEQQQVIIQDAINGQ